MSRDPKHDFIALGLLEGFFGWQGLLKVHSYTEPREHIFEYPNWLLGIEPDTLRNIKVKHFKRSGKRWVVQLEGVANVADAQAFVGQQIWVNRDELPELDDDEYFWADLEGLSVFDKAGQELGQVDRLFATGANDILVVKSTRGDQDILIPFVQPEVILQVDIEAGTIVVDWLPLETIE